MWKIALAQIRATPRRYISILVAIVLGTMFFATSFLISSSMNATMRNALQTDVAQADVVVKTQGADEKLAELAGPPNDPGVLTEISGVASVHGLNYAPSGLELSGPRADEGTNGNMSATADYALVYLMPDDPSFLNQKLLDGDFPDNTSDTPQVAITEDTAEKFAKDIGSKVDISGFTDELHQAEVVGITSDSFTLFSPGQQLLGNQKIFSRLNLDREISPIDTVLIRTEPGANTTQVIAAVEEELLAQDLDTFGLKVSTPQDMADASLEDNSGGQVLLIINGGFAMIALLVTGLVISNIFSVLVAQRAHAYGLQRILGATRRQIRGSVLAESLVIGAIGSLVGIILATVLIAGLVFLARSVFNQPAVAFEFNWAIFITLIVGILVTLVAAWIPAGRAMRVSPMVALQPLEAASSGNRAGILRIIAGSLLTLGGGTLLFFGAFAGKILVAILGGLLSFIGLLMIGILFIPQAVYAVGGIARATGIPGTMAQLNTVRNRSRTSATAVALLVGTTLVSMMLVGARIAQHETTAMIDTQFPMDVAVEVNPNDLDTPPDEQAVLDLSSVEAVTYLHNSTAKVDHTGPEEPGLYIADPETLSTALNGEPKNLDQLTEPDTALVAQGYPDDVITLTTDSGKTVELTAVQTSLGTIPPMVSPQTAQDIGIKPSFEPETNPDLLWIKLDSSAKVDDGPQIINEIAQATGVSADFIRLTTVEKDLISQVINYMLMIVIGLLAMSVIIALIGVANTLSLSTIERTAENSLMRALGLTKSGLRKMLAWEAVLIAGVAAAIGILLGWVYGWMGAYALFTEFRGDGNDPLGFVPPVFPLWELAIVLAIAVIAGLLASVAPSRRATKTSIVEGIHAN